MTPLEVIRAARALLADPTHWTHGAMARSPDGGALLKLPHEFACCWCLVGALRQVASDAVFSFYEARRLLSVSLGLVDVSECGIVGLARWNDVPGRTHGDVLAALDGAIATLETGAA